MVMIVPDWKFEFGLTVSELGYPASSLVIVMTRGYEYWNKCLVTGDRMEHGVSSLSNLTCTWYRARTACTYILY